MNRKSVLTIFLTACALVGVQAQQLKQQGTGVDDLVPEGWTHEEVQGDLNKDGKADLVLIAIPNFTENMKTRDDGYVYNFNQPVLAVYFATDNGELNMWRQYGEILPADEDENCHHNNELSITERGVLVINCYPECSGGSYFSNKSNYSYRFQNGDFYLIGKEEEEVQRNTGNCKLVSQNYLTWKQQVKKWNFAEDDPGTEKWTRLKKKPLEKLGDRNLE